MLIKKRTLVAILFLITGFCLPICPIPLSAQTEGDQILDGIGETALIARYMFEGNFEDRARNHFHATLVKGVAVYADERPFNKALSFTGGYLQIPGRALISADSLTVVGWVYLNSAAPGQRLFDFGLDAGRSFFCELTGTEEASGFRTRITADGPEAEQGPVAKAIPTGRWFHLAIVLDAANHTLSSYINGRPAGRTENVKILLEQILDRKNPAANRLYIGRAQGSETPGLNTKLQDSILFKSTDNQALYVDLYVPSTVTWKERGVAITQSTNFPYADNSKLTISGSGDFAVKVRVPAWATRGFFVSINGKEQPVQAKPGTYLTLQQNWKNGDVIALRMPFQFHLDSVMDQPNLASIFYGPVLLAVEESGPQANWRAVTLDAHDLSKSISGDPATLRFTTSGLTLKPFFESYGYYSVYLDVTLQ